MREAQAGPRAGAARQTPQPAAAFHKKLPGCLQHGSVLAFLQAAATAAHLPSLPPPRLPRSRCAKPPHLTQAKQNHGHSATRGSPKLENLERRKGKGEELEGNGDTSSVAVREQGARAACPHGAQLAAPAVTSADKTPTSWCLARANVGPSLLGWCHCSAKPSREGKRASFTPKQPPSTFTACSHSSDREALPAAPATQGRIYSFRGRIYSFHHQQERGPQLSPQATGPFSH